MAPLFVLVHSPSVGPLTWTQVAAELTVRGVDTVVPSLLDVAEADPPYWPRVVERVAAAIGERDPAAGVVLVAHSNAGLFMPVLAEGVGRPVRACLFVDAAVPSLTGATPVAEPEFLEILRGKAIGGRLPRWTDWWDEADVAPLFDDPLVRAAVTAEQPQLPLAYYEQQVPVPDSWDEHHCGYLLFAPPYDELARQVRERGWLVDELPGEHLHQLVDPRGVAERLLALYERIAGSASADTASGGYGHESDR
jgi:hypothetical protein